ncbi:hypothetical protein OIU85_028388 [Salix viminalis]|uniref:Uncharacterized protein n=1 Tax=Salix viminalis TaxID=40686 RepID=A0A9Q0TBW5_SALVM|nr:hypothetical protein OIU85_028388 [Salix viminalis]
MRFVLSLYVSGLGGIVPLQKHEGEVVTPLQLYKKYIQDARWGSIFYQHHLAECKVHETRSQAHAPSDESTMMTRKQKAGQSKAHEGEQSPKKKAKNGKKNDSRNGKSEDNIAIKSMKSSVKLLDRAPPLNERNLGYE